MDPIATLDLVCPSEGDFYICQGNSTQFIGCCTSDPCAVDGSCPQEHLRSSSFNGSYYNEIQPQACVTSAAEWYTCNHETIPFLGCCSSNPCYAEGCPTDDLTSAKLSDNADDAAIFTTPVSKFTPTVSSISNTTLGMASAHGTSTTVETSPSGTQSSSSDLLLSAKIGIGVGAAAFVALCLTFLFFLKRVLKEKRGRVLGTPGSAEIIVGPEQRTHRRRKRNSFWAPKTTHDTCMDTIGLAITTERPQPSPSSPSHLSSESRPQRTYRPYRPPVAPMYELE